MSPPFLLMLLMSLLIFGCKKSENQLHNERVDCELLKASECLVGSYNWSTQSCVLTKVDNGDRCNPKKYNNPCMQSCTCEEGKPKELPKETDDGNPCTADSCEVHDSKMQRLHTPVAEGTACGPNNQGECRQGMCYLPVDENSTRYQVYFDHPLNKQLQPSEGDTAPE